MHASRPRFTIGTALISVAVISVWLGLVRAIDQLVEPNPPASDNHSFSPQSLLFTIFYFWAVALFLVVRRERWDDGLTLSEDEWARLMIRRFLRWLALAPVAPITMLIIAAIFALSRTPPGAAVGWERPAVAGLMLLHFIHALVGVVVCRELRWPALLVGIISVFVGAIVSLIAGSELRH